ncbi:MAG: hypothetical protein EBZ74_07620, partial [Planctomycetia bacterium]|nr:hypothetical protein [Planctomycetia bacterium]
MIEPDRRSCVPDAAALRGLPREPGRPSGLWLGPTAGAELEAAHECLAERLDLVVCGSLAEARARYDGPTAARGPAYVFLAADRPGRWSLDTAVAAVRRWPLAVIVGVATSLGEG